MAFIELNEVTTRYDPRAREAAVDRVSLGIREGEVMVLLGPSGCGKTTLLKIVAGLVPIEAGEVRIAGASMDGVPPAKRDVAMVFQNYALYPHLRVFDNIAVPLRLRKVPRSDIERMVRETAELLGIRDVLDRLPKTLSGGQRQRVALARAMVRRPKAFLFDEPLSNLDAVLRERARTELKVLFQRLASSTPSPLALAPGADHRATAPSLLTPAPGTDPHATAVLYVTHDQLEAMTLGHRVAVMEKGRILQVGTPHQIYHEPANTFVATFVGAPPMNLLSSEHVLGKPGPLLGIRAEQIRVSERSKAGAVAARVVVVESLGSHAIATVMLTKGTHPHVKVVVPEGRACPPHKHVWLSFPKDKLRRFDPATGASLSSTTPSAPYSPLL